MTRLPFQLLRRGPFESVSMARSAVARGDDNQHVEFSCHLVQRHDPRERDRPKTPPAIRAHLAPLTAVAVTKNWAAGLGRFFKPK
jgi:hypothetical protein